MPRLDGAGGRRFLEAVAGCAGREDFRCQLIAACQPLCRADTVSYNLTEITSGTGSGACRTMSNDICPVSRLRGAGRGAASGWPSAALSPSAGARACSQERHADRRRW